MFKVELAHWFYIDHLVVENPLLLKLQFKDFCRVLFKHVPSLKKHLNDVDNLIERFKEYKSSVPTYGAIILDTRMEKCLMVQGMGNRNNWGFPKGKVNKNEAPHVCAIREVKEEISFDCTSLINMDDFIQKNFRGTEIKLYIIAGVDMKQEFTPATKNEIRSIQWFDINCIPDSFDVKAANGQSFFMAVPFMKDLKDWIRKKRVMVIKETRIKKKERGKQRDSERETQVVPVKEEISFMIPVGRNVFWTKQWECVQLDWKSIWSKVDQEFGVAR